MTTEQDYSDVKLWLSLAATKIDALSKTEKPFRRSKFLNMLQKEIRQLEMELIVFLGHHDFKILDYPELLRIPSYNILEAMQRDNELHRK